jgi:hypothetical protein
MALEQGTIDVADDVGGWLEFARATGFAALAFYLIVVERPRIEKRLDDQNIAFRKEIFDVVNDIYDEIKTIRNGK